MFKSHILVIQTAIAVRNLSTFQKIEKTTKGQHENPMCFHHQNSKLLFILNSVNLKTTARTLLEGPKLNENSN